MNAQYARMRLAETCKMLYDRELTVSAGGNMSVKLDDDYILITPSGKNKGLLEPEDFLVVDMKTGECVEEGKKPSVETGMHIGLYRNNPDTNAVVHCHPLNCIAVTMKRGGLKTDLTPEGVLLLGKVPMVGYYTPGSKELADAVAACASSDAILMEKHGAVTQGRDLVEAYNRMEELEFQAKLQMTVGRCRSLPAAEVEKLMGMR